MDEYSQKYLMDVLNACEEVESFFGGKKIFSNFQTDILRQRAVERAQRGDYGRGHQSVAET